MTTAQRQGKTSFYIRCTGEEAIAVGHSLELRVDDMFFPTYRQQGWLIARRWPLVEMMCQVFSNEKDRLHGRQMPIMYSARRRLLLHLGQPRHPIRASGRVGDGIRHQRRHANRFRRRRRRNHGRGRLPSCPHVRNHVPGTGDPQRRQQPVGDLVVPRHRRWQSVDVRGACHRLRIPALRVDGNDYLAVIAAPRWAAERERTNHGPTLIEWVTYRAGSLDIRRSVAIPPGGRMEVVAAGRPDRTPQEPPHRRRRVVRRTARRPRRRH